MILKNQNLSYSNSDSISNSSAESPFFRNEPNYSNKLNLEFSNQLEKTLNYLLREYQDIMRNGVSSEYGNAYAQYSFHTGRIEKRGIPEIHMKKQNSNTKLRTCNDMSGILGKLLSNLQLCLINI